MSLMLETQELGITFGGLKAVQDLNIKVEKNELYGLIGPNGAGKTTVFNMLTGVYKPTSGRFYLDGEDLTGKSQIVTNHKGIARTFQNIRLFSNMTVIQNVLVGLNNRREYKCNPMESMLRLPRHFSSEKKMGKRAKELLEIFGLEGEADALACNLPYGKQRKLEIARALATNPRLLLLDEPAAGMNEHDLKFVSGLCDEVTVLNFGTALVQGKVSDALNDPEVIKAYIGN